MKIDARGWIFQIFRPAVTANPSATPPVAAAPEAWLDIDGLNTFEIDPSENNEDVDTTTFRSDGEYEGEMMQRGSSLELEGFKEYLDDGTRDPGQAAVDKLATKKSRESVGKIRFRHDTESEWTHWNAYAEGGGVGGGNNDKTSWGATLTKSGAATVADVETPGGGS